ncbi:MAG: hypothetical protein IPP32_04575 [Bacteroidetes bacterium]|nr:hypothetical protein [Bacteroidota bacterium]
MGYNKYSFLRRGILALFCFVAYYWSENPKPVDVSGVRIGSYPVQDIPNSGSLFFLLGMIILIISIGLFFVLHIKTIVSENSITLDGIWTSRKVKIDLDSIVDAKKIPYSSYYFNVPEYNLHRKGKIKFYTFGNEALELTDKEGLKYIIGTQKAGEFLAILHNRINHK